MDTRIKIDDFERGMKHIHMNEKDTSWVSRVITYLSEIKILREDTHISLSDKKLIWLMMRGVTPRLKRRIPGLIDSGTTEERKALKGLKV